MLAFYLNMQVSLKKSGQCEAIHARKNSCAQSIQTENVVKPTCFGFRDPTTDRSTESSKLNFLRSQLFFVLLI